MRRERPVVVFVDNEGWSSFDQVAIALRRRRMRVVRVVTGPLARFSQMLKDPHLRWATDRLCFDEVISLSSDGAWEEVRALLDSGRVVDVITNEPTLREIGLETPIGQALTAHSLSFCGSPPRVLLDKFAVNARLAEAGLGIPRQAWAHTLSPSQAIRTFGLPIVIKRPMGASGDQVRIASTAAEIERALCELGHPDEPLFYQEHVPGKVVVYGAIAGPAGPFFDHGFRIEKAQWVRGPAALASLHDTPALLAAGRRALEALKPQGFASFGFIETDDGRLLHIDANIRPWGMIAVGLPLGIDFAKSYARVFGQSAPPRAKPSAKGAVPLPVFPHAIYHAALEGRPSELWAASATLSGYVRGLGLRYYVQTLARAALLVARRIRHPQPAPRAIVQPSAAEPVLKGKALQP